MSRPLIAKLPDCPKTLDYLTVNDEECPLVWDINALTEELPKLVTASDGGENFDRLILSISWVIVHLRQIYNEVREGGGK